ncbi:hypothetical protein GCM10007977_020410 [Dactylosporangium sucinum]|uniref:Uncharacterized protein n=1 Tax=Dactylosporangium sucinum TaxID=1424081 RepID=A0A917WPP8_9ACTN|nr:hypothetical protein GCM10007977_020410 [Dactylosporangium sucinum]
MLRLDVPQVDAERLDLLGGRAEDAVREQPGVQTDHLVPGLTKYRHQHAADVSVVTSDEYAHGKAPERSAGGRRVYEDAKTPSVVCRTSYSGVYRKDLVTASFLPWILP